MEQQSPVTAHLFTTRLSEYFKPPVETYCSEGGKDSSQNITVFRWQYTWLPRSSSREMYNKINVVNRTVHTTAILQPLGGGVISNVKSRLLRSTAIVIAKMDRGKTLTPNLLERIPHPRCHWEHLLFIWGDQHSSTFTNSLTCSLFRNNDSATPTSFHDPFNPTNSTCDFTSGLSQTLFRDSIPTAHYQGDRHDPFMPLKPVPPGRHVYIHSTFHQDETHPYPLWTTEISIVMSLVCSYH